MAQSVRVRYSGKVEGSKVEGPAASTDMAVYEVNEVYLHIPAELSAATVELQIKGAVRLIDEVS